MALQGLAEPFVGSPEPFGLKLKSENGDYERAADMLWGRPADRLVPRLNEIGAGCSFERLKSGVHRLLLVIIVTEQSPKVFGRMCTQAYGGGVVQS